MDIENLDNLVERETLGRFLGETNEEREFQIFKRAFSDLESAKRICENGETTESSFDFPEEITTEEKIDTLYELVPQMVEYINIKRKYEEFGTPEELEILFEDMDGVFEKIENLLRVVDEMTFDLESYRAKGWTPILVSNRVLPYFSSLSIDNIKFIREDISVLSDEKREVGFLYLEDETTGI